MEGEPVEPAPKSEPLDWLERLTGRRKERAETQTTGRVAETPTVSPSVPQATAPESDADDTTDYLQAQARQYEAEGQMLLAALCYDLLGDQANSGRCYRQMGLEGTL
jgi:hypothetical protein